MNIASQPAPFQSASLYVGELDHEVTEVRGMQYYWSVHRHYQFVLVQMLGLWYHFYE